MFEILRSHQRHHFNCQSKKIKDITIDIAAEAIRARKQDVSQMLVIPIDKIQTEVGNFYGVSIKEMKGSRRLQNIVLARQVAMYLFRELTDNSLPKLGRNLGKRSYHSHSCPCQNKIFD